MSGAVGAGRSTLSATRFLFSGWIFLGLGALTSYGSFGLGVISPDNPVVLVLIISLALFAGGGLFGGLYLLLRVLV
jgi:hypothetical protein